MDGSGYEERVVGEEEEYDGPTCGDAKVLRRSDD